MKLYLAFVILVASCLLFAQAAPEKKNLAQKSRQAEQLDAKVGGVASSSSSSSSAAGAKDPSSGRLFLKKFLTFKNLFSSSNQPVIPIIITGAGTGTTTGTTSPTSPTVTVTSTGTIPSATGTITTSPTTPTSTTTARRTVIKGARYGSQDQDQDQDQAEQEEKDQDQDQGEDQELEQAAQMPAQAYPADLMDEQALQAALAAGAQEYEVVTTDHELQGTGGSSSGEGAKATQSNSNTISLRRKGARRGQVISVRIPPRYRRYFKNGQKVMLNTGSRPGSKRRVVRKRLPAKKVNNKGNKQNNRRRNGNKKNRRNRNKNRRNRLTAV